MSDSTEPLYVINTALTQLALDLGVNVTEQWEDEVLNDLTHHVAEAFGLQEGKS